MSASGRRPFAAPSQTPRSAGWPDQGEVARVQVTVVERHVAPHPLRLAADQDDVEHRRRVAGRLDPAFAVAVGAGVSLAASMRMQLDIILAASLAGGTWHIELAPARLYRDILQRPRVLGTTENDNGTVGHAR